MCDQSQQLNDAIRALIEDHLTGADVQLFRCACLTAASELVAQAACAVSEDSPGMPVVELLLLSERIASLTVTDGKKSDTEE